MKKFNEWLEERQIKENSGDYWGKDIQDQNKDAHKNIAFLHPLHPHRGLDGQFPSGRGGGQVDSPNMYELEKYIEDGLKRSSSNDAITSLHNLAANALHKDRIPGAITGHDGRYLDDHESRGGRPGEWDFTLMLQRLGFRDSTSFFNWFNDRDGKNIVKQLEKKIRQKLEEDESKRWNAAGQPQYNSNEYPHMAARYR